MAQADPQITIFNINGPTAFVWPIDANYAVNSFPDEWKLTEWTDDEKAEVELRHEAAKPYKKGG